MVGKNNWHISKTLCTIALKPSKFTQKMLPVIHGKYETDRITFHNSIGMRQVKVPGQSSCLRLWCRGCIRKVSSDWPNNGIHHNCL